MPSVLTLVLILLAHTMQVIRHSWMELAVLACPGPLVPHGLVVDTALKSWLSSPALVLWSDTVKELAVPTCPGPVVQHGVKELMSHLLWACSPTQC